ncbi:MAG: hypothetical protein ACKVOW_11030 [Chitinophagaceae bacterium]
MSKILCGLLLWFLLKGEFPNTFAKVDAIPMFVDSFPSLLKGNFMDDYGIRYTTTDSLWIQHPGIRYHILKYNRKENYIIAKNDETNSSNPSLYTRIDYMLFANMKPYEWGFCLSVYNATTDSAAQYTYQADRANPRKGCNGFPFSRMKKIN